MLKENFLDENSEELEHLKTEIINIQSTHLKGYMLRSKFQWTLQGEKPARYFCSLEKYNAITTGTCKCWDKYKQNYQQMPRNQLLNIM